MNETPPKPPEASPPIAPVDVEAIVRWHDAERRGLGRQLHDHTGQELTAALLSLRRIEDLLDRPEDARRELAPLRDVLAGAVRSVRRISALAAPAPPGADDLADVVESVALAFAGQTGLAVGVDVATARVARVPARTAPLLHRVVLEALANVARHSGAARATVTLERDGDLLRLSVADDGRGPSPGAPPGIGLTGAREELRLVGGRLRLGPAPSGGCLPTAEVPA